MERSVRKATKEDFGRVMTIPEHEELYGGYDYLPNDYYTLLTWHGAYVLEVNGKVVGFLAYEIVDKGTAYIPLAGRVSPSLRGQVIKMLIKVVIMKNSAFM